MCKINYSQTQQGVLGNMCGQLIILGLHVLSIPSSGFICAAVLS